MGPARLCNSKVEIPSTVNWDKDAVYGTIQLKFTDDRDMVDCWGESRRNSRSEQRRCRAAELL